MEKYEKQKKAFYGLYDGEKITLLNEYLGNVNYTDHMIYFMDEIDEILYGITPDNIIRLAFYGNRFNFEQDNFNPNNEYFSFNGYGNLVSISGYDLEAYCDLYLDDMINAGALEHLIEEEEEEEEEEGGEN